jgi:DNA polymerase-3 subunit epsilon
MAGSRYGLVRPAAAPSPTSVTIHGIRAQDLQGGLDQDQLRRMLSASLSRRFLVTWFSGIENGFLDKMFPSRRGLNGWRSRNIDVRGLVLSDSTRVSDEKLNLSGAAKRYGVPVEDPHNALDDALVTAQLFLILASRFDYRRGGSVRDLLRAGRTEAVPA